MCRSSLEGTDCQLWAPGGDDDDGDDAAADDDDDAHDDHDDHHDHDDDDFHLHHEVPWQWLCWVHPLHLWF